MQGTETERIWIDYDPDRQDYLVEGFLKVDGGIKHLICRYRFISLPLIRSELEAGYFSQRPFVLGTGCDGTGDVCCHALFHRFCLEFQLDPVALFRKAYQVNDWENYRDPDYSAILQHANWQGVVYPQCWGKAEFDSLIFSLYDINNRSLVEVLSELPVVANLGGDDAKVIQSHT
ncbi:hypothetical protein [Acaryochloris marina]|uniref:hypothetical protein n=1 Tax=Acaryochloris marina TaxID=155978 RepID=UPI0021C2BFCF|nr:hypothetical protein [Acaryochloris marina]BDM83574.1 hypothetical protein AM10699_64350 [Acaryochloris marina MBIC10699]